MSKKLLFNLLAVLMLASLVLSACGAPATEAPAIEIPTAEVPAMTEAPSLKSPLSNQNWLVSPCPPKLVVQTIRDFLAQEK
jgi:hypothetical protein